MDGRILNRVHNLLGKRACVKRLGPFVRDQSEGAGIGGVFEQMPFWHRCPCAVFVLREEIIPHGPLAVRADPVAHKGFCKPRGDDETVRRQLQCGLEEIRPWKVSVVAVRLCQHGDNARHTNSTTGSKGCEKPHLAVFIVKELRRGPHGRCFAPVVCVKLRLGRLPVKHIGPACKAGGLRFCEGEHCFNRNGCIHGTAASRKNFITCICGVRIGGGDHKVSRSHIDVGGSACVTVVLGGDSLRAPNAGECNDHKQTHKKQTIPVLHRAILHSPHAQPIGTRNMGTLTPIANS